MCGIAGKVTGREPVSPELIGRMCDAIRHRGPDGEGIHVEGPVGLGMRRLAIIDLVTGDQPLASEDGKVIAVFNGEIYNHLALRVELEGRGHRFRGHSDGETIVHLYEEHGPECVTRLAGMFAFALWDERERRLLLARDRVGKKPLFYARAGDALLFASEPRSILLDPSVPRDVDHSALDAFLVNQYVPHDLCAFRALSKLAPATTLLWRPGEEPRLSRYWSLEYEPKDEMPVAEAEERLREAILEATRARLMSDVPLGAFLSGGVDSSVVVAAMAMTSADPVRTFSVAFPGSEVDESPHARAVAERYGTDHTELAVGPPEASLLPRIAWHFGEPFADPAALPTFQLAELTRRHVTVALNGDGGDESFAGYRRYWQLARTRPADALPAGLRRALAGVAQRVAGGAEGRAPLPRAARLAARLAMPPARRYADLFRYFSDADRDRLYTPEFRADLGSSDPLRHLEVAWNGRAGLAAVDRLMAVDFDTYLCDDLLAKVDVTSMANSLEVRSPLLDHRLMELAAAMPVRRKLRGTEGKVLLRDAVREWLPDGILDRPKQGFAVPLEGWLRGEMRSLPEEVLLDPVATARDIFRPDAVRGLIAEHREGHDRADQIWAMINLELWFRTCVDQVVAAPSELPTLA
jgi:asparagine synthase (glutamine-hydrolysing)